MPCDNFRRSDGDTLALAYSDINICRNYQTICYGVIRYNVFTSKMLWLQYIKHQIYEVRN